MKDFIISGHVISNIGLRLPNNEDNYLINGSMNEGALSVSEDALNIDKRNRQWNWVAVFDGMGGGERGEIASRIAAEELKKSMEKAGPRASEEEIEILAQQGFLNANRRIVEERRKRSVLGTTGTLLCFRQNKAKLFYLGDSRAYLLREGRLYQLTKDQTLANLKIEAGIYKADCPEAQKDRHMLTEYIGADNTMTSLKPLESTWITLKAVDKMMLCSDGLHHLCSDQEIKEILLSDNEPKQLAKQLVGMALERGGTDNITDLVLTVRTENTSVEE